MFGITEPKMQATDELRAYQIAVDIKFDLDLAEITVTSWNLDGFRLAGADLFDLLERAPGAIAEWIQERHGVEVAVIPVHSTFDPKKRRPQDGYVVIPMRSIVAAARDVALKP